jgi:hypothetical protein
MGIGWREFVIVLAVGGLLVWLKLRHIFRGPGPFVFGFATVPVDDPPPPRDPVPKPEQL